LQTAGSPSLFRSTGGRPANILYETSPTLNMSVLVVALDARHAFSFRTNASNGQ
jgi:hypothetical protein